MTDSQYIEALERRVKHFIALARIEEEHGPTEGIKRIWKEAAEYAESVIADRHSELPMFLKEQAS